MKLWFVSKRTPGHEAMWGYDCYYAHVVRAETEHQARSMVPSGDEGASVWLDPAQTTCEELPAQGEPEVILSDFLAG